MMTSDASYMLQGKGSWLPRLGTTWVSGNTSVRDSRTKPAVARLCSLKIALATNNKIIRNN